MCVSVCACKYISYTMHVSFFRKLFSTVYSPTLSHTHTSISRCLCVLTIFKSCILSTFYTLFGSTFYSIQFYFDKFLLEPLVVFVGLKTHVPTHTHRYTHKPIHQYIHSHMLSVFTHTFLIYMFFNYLIFIFHFFSN